MSATPPTIGAPAGWQFPAIQRLQLDSGLEIRAVHTPGRPLAGVFLVTEAGAANEPDDKAGVASLSARTILEGTAARDAAGFADAVESLGADISANADFDSLRAYMKVPVSRLSEALPLLAEAVTQAEFAAGPFERIKAERLARIDQELATPAMRAMIEFPKTIYTGDSTYARPSEGTKESVASVTRDDAEAFFRRYATPESATLVVSGDLEGLDLAAVAAGAFGTWAVEEPERPKIVTRDAVEETTVTIVNVPGAVQSQMAIGHVGLPRTVNRYAHVKLMEGILGGMFNSRINEKLREEKGYTYGARCTFDYRREAGPFLVYAPVQTEVTVPAITDAIAEIRRTHDDGVTADELRAAQQYLTGILPVQFERPEALAQAVANMAVYGLADDHIDTMLSAMRAATVDEVSAAAREHLRPDRLSILVVGDAEQVEAPLRDAGLGPVTVLQR